MRSGTRSEEVPRCPSRARKAGLSAEARSAFGSADEAASRAYAAEYGFVGEAPAARFSSASQLARSVDAEEAGVVAARAKVPFPEELQGGPADVRVYLGMRDGKPVYVGITNDLARRGAQHGSRFVLDELTESPLTRGEARAIEQAIIGRNAQFENVINSISPSHPYYYEAVQWGEDWLTQRGLGGLLIGE